MLSGLQRSMLPAKQFNRLFYVSALNPIHMKTLRYWWVLLFCATLFSSCSVWNRMFPPKYGCGTNGKNVGAEKLLDGSYDKKPPKFKI